MRFLRPIGRRQVIQGMGAALALAPAARAARAGEADCVAGAHVRVVGIRKFAFGPEVKEITAGDCVTWINEDVAPHTATGMDDAWDTGSLNRGKAGTVRFEKPGEYPYFCRFHPQMTGRVIVRSRDG